MTKHIVYKNDDIVMYQVRETVEVRNNKFRVSADPNDIIGKVVVIKDDNNCADIHYIYKQSKLKTSKITNLYLPELANANTIALTRKLNEVIDCINKRKE